MRRDGYTGIENYAAIGDGRTVALIAADGRIDWLPVPNLDTRPVFAALLDADEGGYIALHPVGDYSTERSYLEGTNVLVTTFTTDTGVVRTTDSLNTGVAGRLPWTELARRVEGVSGTVDMEWAVVPGTCLGNASPWAYDTVHGTVLRVDGITLGVRTLNADDVDKDTRSIRGRFAATAGSRSTVAVVGTEVEPLYLPTPEEVDAGIDRTVRNWQSWSEEFRYDGPWKEAVHRSALALKLLLYSPSGAIAAAATTSLPERWAGAKNWDYRYAWVRDAAYTIKAMIRFGLREEVHAAVAWLLRIIRRNDKLTQVFYTLNGEIPSGSSYPDVPGWRGIGPVIAGNDAATQLQQGIFGDLFDIVSLYVDAGNILDAPTGRLLAAIADTTCDIWRSKDAGLWELPDEQHYTSSKMGCWHALDRAVHLSEQGMIPGIADRWVTERDRIAEWIHDHCWSETKQAYVWYPGTDKLDASVLLHAGSPCTDDARMSSTIDALRSELGADDHLYRYSGMQTVEGTFVACSFWVVNALAHIGREDEASDLMDRLVTSANDVGLWAEMVDPHRTPDRGTTTHLGNFPQGLSHLALINSALTLARGHDHTA
ncbi:glycoside hydrolase family 15 protein [Rhodococcoides corynebacterioides]|uniref:Glycoside hydrolase family 15 protein n=1 Tax=Rhodococcoides corynebacterioides TaxID=53972 RepID=A0ABS7P5A5_9NOCA|nr:glycoside hydrolase family 15 protein [Rhodococcus corynebacterioides]MBY6367592.1 glycoside hydrolase family 15 protein [Rhodococcus corynebacterioides]MBY6407814.1 glycoside hydrolase family 15 protein [Rhodococcus corynebacterioides]